MRVTSSMYYQSLYGSKNNELQSKLFDVNKQIASGLKIQYAQDDISAFTDTMRLDNEITTITQVKKSTESGYKFSNQTDIVLNEFNDTMDRTRTLLLNAANGIHSTTSLDAIADELRVLEDHFKNLANTSINGQYLFSGTSVDIKPISTDGTYNGNDGSLSAFLGSKIDQQYNISGEQLFLGEEVLVKKEVTTNVIQTKLSDQYDFSTHQDTGKVPIPIKSDDTIRDLMGDTDDFPEENNQKHHFYLSGVRSNGDSFNKKISLSDEDEIDTLLQSIGDAYGNTPNLTVVNVSLISGQIIVEDKIKGSSKLDFHMVGATDFNHTDGTDNADVNNISDLDSGEINFGKIMNNTSSADNPNLYIKEFIKSPFKASTDAPQKVDGLLYDKTNFTKDGALLSSNVSQIIKNGNGFATPSTKISEVADISKGTDDISDDTLDGNSFKLVGKNIKGDNIDVKIDFKSSGSTFSLDTNGNGSYDTTYDIFDMGDPRKAIKADDMTYQQLMDVMDMVVTDNLPTGSNADDYDTAIEKANFEGKTYLSYDGKLTFGEIDTSITKAEISLHDINSGDFSSSQGSVLAFNANNSLIINDAKTDFFKEIDEMIVAVENHKAHPDHTKGDMRNVGIENAITKLDRMQEHFAKTHSMVGAQSNALSVSLERTQLLEISTMTLRSSVVDTDLAEASLKLTQLSLNFEAMLSTVGKISKLNLVNYL